MSSKRLLAVSMCVAALALPACGSSSAGDTVATSQELSNMEKLAEGWAYDNQVDEMRGETTRFASVRAQEWGSMAPELYVFRKPGRDPQLAIRGSVDEAASPQMRCSGSLNMKFDNGPVRQVDCQLGMAVLIDPAIIADLRKSKTTWIEIETSLGSTMQYKFNTANLTI